jgi:hypothetical protein
VVVDQRGGEPIERGLRDLYQAIKTVDGGHPITHANWPLAKDLDLGFFDIVSFNVYPLWPPQVVAMGYANYVKQVLQPIAGGKPLLLSEFGVNTVEAGEEGQARLLKQSWEGLREAGAIGGFAFEFADEWWKNYDNPRGVGNWWERVPAPNDEQADDQDPEEHYGLVTADRQPKPAYGVVREMFATDSRADGRVVPAAMVAMVILVAAGAWLWSTHTNRPTGPERRGELVGRGVARSPSMGRPRHRTRDLSAAQGDSNTSVAAPQVEAVRLAGFPGCERSDPQQQDIR